MREQERVVVEEALAAWRAAERELQGMGADAPEREACLARLAAARTAYQRAVVASSGRIAEREAALTEDPVALGDPLNVR
jgi:hypothetical protein